MKLHNNIKLYVTAMILMAGIYSCQKADIPLYQNDPGIFIYKDVYDVNADSTNYSFAIKNTALVQDTIWIPVRIMGETAPEDRQIDFEPVDSLTTAEEGTHYELMTPYVMPANAFATKLGVIVKRSSDLKDATVRLTLRLKPTADFKEVLFHQADYLITVNDILTKPANWDSWLIHFFGSYSQVKYRFIIDVTGRAEFPSSSGGLEIAEFFYYQSTMKNALNEYNKAHPQDPMKDENGNLVSF